MSSKDGKRALINFEGGNFYLFNTKHQKVDHVYLSQSAEELKEIAWVNGSSKSAVTPNHEIYLEKAKIADLGVYIQKENEKRNEPKMIWDEPIYKPTTLSKQPEFPKYGKCYNLNKV